MYIKTLIDNICLSDEFSCEHGLSLYIETAGHKILFDTGSSNKFYENAKKLGVDIAKVDFLVISHGHYDHGGGLELFLKKNKTAKVYISQYAFEDYFSSANEDEMLYAGLDKNLKSYAQIVFTGKKHIIAKGFEVFSEIKTNYPLPSSNSGLFVQKNGQIIDDNFAHEQIFIIKENGKTMLLTGCAHNGIINIIEHYKTIYGDEPDVVIGGFHLYSRSSGGSEDDEIIKNIADYLLSTKAKFYTCHCTGKESFDKLKLLMGDRIGYLHSGSEITLK